MQVFPKFCELCEAERKPGFPKKLAELQYKMSILKQKYESYWKRSRFANDLHGDKYKKRMQEEKHVSLSKGNVLFEYQ